ncbi:hypothetical protein EC991_008842 [Linnemannia zychae]|nr:hypothetical protein EC991_008842 [Linnemannia zychae]
MTELPGPFIKRKNASSSMSWSHKRILSRLGILRRRSGFGIVLKVIGEPERHQAMRVPKPKIGASESLAALMTGRDTLMGPEDRWFVPRIAEGIRRLNSKGMAHGDIKLANILLAADMISRPADLNLLVKLSPGESKFRCFN